MAKFEKRQERVEIFPGLFVSGTFRTKVLYDIDGDYLWTESLSWHPEYHPPQTWEIILEMFRGDTIQLAELVYWFSYYVSEKNEGWVLENNPIWWVSENWRSWWDEKMYKAAALLGSTYNSHGWGSPPMPVGPRLDFEEYLKFLLDL